jgi:hypothetical protein
MLQCVGAVQFVSGSVAFSDWIGASYSSMISGRQEGACMCSAVVRA